MGRIIPKAGHRGQATLQAILVCLLASIAPLALCVFADPYVGHVVTVRNVDYYPLVDMAQRFDPGALATWVGALHPIGYPLLLRLGLAAGLDVVQTGHGLSVAGGVLLLLSTYLLAYRLTGDRWLALLAEGFLVTTGSFLFFATMEGNDMLAAGLQTLSLAILAGLPERNRSNVVAGVLAGLAYLIRYTAIVTTGFCLLFLVGRALERRRCSMGAIAGLFLVGFLVSASLQLIPSLLVTGNPLYSVQGHNVWWHVERREYYVTEWDEAPMDISLVEVFVANPRGFIRHWWGMARSFWIDPDRLLLDTPIRLLSQAGLLFTLLAGKEIGAQKRLLLALYAGGYLAGLALIRYDARYMLILLPVLVLSVAYFLWTIVPRHLSVGRLALPVRTTVLVALLGWSGIVPLNYLRNTPTSSAKVIGVTNTLRAGGMAEASEVLSTAMHYHDVSDPARTRFVQSYWATPDLSSVEELHAVAVERGYHFVLYDADRGPIAHPQLEGLLDPNSRPPGLTPLLVHESRKYVLYRIESGPPEPAHPLDVQLDGSVALEGYDLYVSHDVYEEDVPRVGLFLYWQATRPVSRSYKVFVHVLDTGGNLVTQDDSLPAVWTYRTDEWQVGEIVVDFHSLALPPSLPSGTYTVQVGMYDEATMQRLPVLSSVGAPEADRVTLTQFAVDSDEKGRRER